MSNQLEWIRQESGNKRWAIIGYSRDPKAFSRALAKEMAKAGYEMLPVNSNAAEIDGVPCYRSVGEIDPRPETVLVMTAKEQYAKAVEECAAADVKRVWLYGVLGAKDVPADASAAAERLGVELITGFCPLMLMPGTGGFHHFHGFIWKLLGFYPK